MIQSLINLLRHNHSLFVITSIINKNKGGKGREGERKKKEGVREGGKSEDGKGKAKNRTE